MTRAEEVIKKVKEKAKREAEEAVNDVSSHLNGKNAERVPSSPTYPARVKSVEERTKLIQDLRKELKDGKSNAE